MKKNKTVLILGASSDIGISTIKVFIKNNWNIVAHYNRSDKKLKLFKKKNNLKLFKADLRKPINPNKFFLKSNYFQEIDSFISLTGYIKPKDYKNFKVKEFNEHVNVNYLNNQLFARFLLKQMSKKKWGRILVTSSIGTKFGGGLNTYMYSISKFMNEFIPQIFRKYAKNNVFYNCLRIGLTDTKLNKVDKSKNLKKRISLIPIKRIAKPMEIADYIYYLSSEKNTYINLQTTTISGGE